eukprot:664261-Rhodomonas_salina.2
MPAAPMRAVTAEVPIEFPQWGQPPTSRIILRVIGFFMKACPSTRAGVHKMSKMVPRIPDCVWASGRWWSCFCGAVGEFGPVTQVPLPGSDRRDRTVTYEITM